jgi:hypothetical protein
MVVVVVVVVAIVHQCMSPISPDLNLPLSPYLIDEVDHCVAPHPNENITSAYPSGQV